MNVENHINDIFFNYKIFSYPDVICKLLKNEKVSPINLEINVTNVCNQNCIWCTYKYLHKNPETLSKEDVLKILNDARRLKIKSITWTGGGEPSVHKHLKNFIKTAALYGFCQGIHTNGLLLDEELIDLICMHFTYVRISLDATCCKTYESCHQVSGKNFYTVVDNIKKIVKKKKSLNSNLTVGISFLVGKENYKEIKRATETSKDLGVNYIQYKPVVDYNMDNNFYTKRIWNKIQKSFKSIKNMETNEFKIRILDYKFNKLQNYKKTYSSCWGCKVLSSIGANGSVDLCCALKGNEKFSLGNIKQHSFYDIWQSDNIEKILAMTDISKCPPLCKGEEINRLINFIKDFNAHKEFM